MESRAAGCAIFGQRDAMSSRAALSATVASSLDTLHLQIHRNPTSTENKSGPADSTDLNTFNLGFNLPSVLRRSDSLWEGG